MFTPARRLAALTILAGLIHAGLAVRIAAQQPGTALHAAAHVGAQASSGNLILNPGNDAPLVGDEIPNWVEIAGAGWTQGFTVAPQSGLAYFRPGPGKNLELRQDVDVSAFAVLIDGGQQDFAFEGHVQSLPQNPMDSARFVIEYRSLAGALLDAYDSGEQTIAGTWYPLTDTRSAPPGTRTIRIRLLAKRYTGTYNSAFFDSLSLVAIEPTAWADLGGGLAGVAGIPGLASSSELAAGTPGVLGLASAAPLAPTLLLVSLSSTPTPFKGGVLAAVPVSFQFALTAGLDGAWTLGWPTWPAGLPHGFKLYFQALVPDSTAVQGVAISNLLEATQP